MNSDSPHATLTQSTEDNPSQRRYAEVINQDIRRINHTLTTYGGYQLTIRGSSHRNYSDSPLYTPIKSLSRAGQVEVDRAMRVINAYALAFFDCYLKGTKPCLLDGGSEFPEVVFESAPIPSRIS